MDLTQAVTIDPAEARTIFAEYKAAAAKSHSVEDALLARGYKALAQGKRLIDLSATLAAGGVYDSGYPKLAAIRSDAEFVWVEMATDGRAIYRDQEWTDDNRTRHRIETRPLFAKRNSPLGRWRDNSLKRAIVPSIPPAHRPAFSLGNYTTMWEVPEDGWQDAPRPPSDPALLRQLQADLYIVLATWDLTPLEQLVLGAMRRPKA